jgi:hypothetical protein
MALPSPTSEIITPVPSHGGEVAKEHWQRRCEELAQENDRLRAELAQMTKERDDYLKALNAMIPEPDIDCTKEELFAQIDPGPSILEIIEEFRRD